MSSEFQALHLPGQKVFFRHEAGHAARNQVFIQRSDHVATSCEPSHPVPLPRGWFPILPAREPARDTTAGKVVFESRQTTTTSTVEGPQDIIHFHIELLPAGTFTPNEGGAGGHGVADSGSGAVLPGIFNTKREKYKGEETEEDFVQLVPALLQAARNELVERVGGNDYKGHSAAQIVGCILEFYTSTQSHHSIHDVARFQTIIDGPAGWMRWASETIESHENGDQ